MRSPTLVHQPTALSAIGDFLRRHQRAIVALQWALVLFYAVLLVVPAFMALPPERATILDNLTRFAQFLFWGIWWPFVLLSVIAFGRLWCGFLCPEGALTEWASRHGAGKRMPPWLRWSGWPFVAFGTTTIYGQMVSVYEYPKPVLVILGGSTLAAIGVGLLYGKGKRLWCRHLCPVSGVFALLARLSPFHYKVDLLAWAQSPARAQPINCAPLVHIKSMTGAAECHMCARCSGHKQAIRLAARWPGREVIETTTASVWQSRLVVWGMLGIAAGAFQWSASPWLVAAKQRIAAWLIERDIAWPLAPVGHWWLFTHYPDVNDVFTWLDGAMLLGYISATALALGTSVSIALWLAEKALGREDARHGLALALTPLAGFTIFLGLFTLTTTQLAAEGLRIAWLPQVRAAVLAVAVFWSATLAFAWIRRQRAHAARRLSAFLAMLAASALPVASYAMLFYGW
ncbi:MAG TPA: 4Fe-4S binding protein [Burkholderiales bacterium]